MERTIQRESLRYRYAYGWVSPSQRPVRVNCFELAGAMFAATCMYAASIGAVNFMLYVGGGTAWTSVMGYEPSYVVAVVLGIPVWIGVACLGYILYRVMGWIPKQPWFNRVRYIHRCLRAWKENHICPTYTVI